MISKSVLLFAVVALIVCIDQGFALKCWQCNSRHNSDCADPFNNRSLGYATDCIPIVGQLAQCRKIVHKENGQWNYIRGCNLNDNLLLKEAKIHYCNVDGCNSADINGPISVIATIAAPILMRVMNLF